MNVKKTYQYIWPINVKKVIEKNRKKGDGYMAMYFVTQPSTRNSCIFLEMLGKVLSSGS